SVVRVSADQWSPPGTIAMSIADKAQVTNSIIAGDFAVVLDPGFNDSNTDKSLLLNSVLVGQSSVHDTQVANDILVSDHGTLLIHVDGAQTLSGVDVRNNVFITHGRAAVAETVQRDTYNLGLIFGGETINDPMAWFRSAANRVEGNRMA